MYVKSPETKKGRFTLSSHYSCILISGVILAGEGTGGLREDGVSIRSR